ncbi:MAG: hypothetical protein WB507_02470 [Solirubrobacterales bacterium]
MPSVRTHTSRAGALAICGVLLAGAIAGCTTTEEKAAREQARAKRILRAQEQRRDRSAADRSQQEHR